MAMRTPLRLVSLVSRARFTHTTAAAITPRLTAAPRTAAAALPSFRLASRWSSSSSSSSSSTPDNASSSSTPSAPDSSSSSPDAASIEAPSTPGAKPQQLGKIEPRLAMTFTCTAGAEKDNPTCGHRSTHEFSKKSYEKGIVIVQCPECKARHLIADHLGWFKESTDGGKLKTIEDLMRAKGEEIKKGKVNMDGDIEYAPSN